MRAAVHRDLRAIAAIERAVFPDPWTHGMFVAHLRYAPANMFMVAEDATGAIVGYALTLTAADEAQLLNIAVHPDARRRGIGIALLRATMRECAAAGAESMVLEVRESNEGARALYDAHGFAPVGRRKGYYHSPREDAIVMRAPLATETVAAEAGNETMPPARPGLPVSAADSILSSASQPPRQETP
jgi:ribosomal-protein-alanine N-acetyltransferase